MTACARTALFALIVIGATLMGLPCSRAAAPRTLFPAAAAASSPASSSAAPSNAAPSNAAPSTGDLQTLAQTLQDPARRAALLSQINGLIALRLHDAPPAENARTPPATTTANSAPAAVAAPPADAPVAAPAGPGDALVGSLASSARQLGTALSALSIAAPLRAAAAWVASTAADPHARTMALLWLAQLVAVIAAAAIAERIARAALSRLRRRLAPRPGRSHLRALLALFADAVVRLIPVAVFVFAGTLALSLALAIHTPAAASTAPIDLRALVVALLAAHAVAAAITALVEMTLAHNAAAQGAGQADPHEETVDYWLIWLARLVRLATYSFFLLRFWRQMGMDPATYAIAARLLGVLFAGLLVMLILQSRAAVGRLIRGRTPLGEHAALQSVRDRIAGHWHIAAILYVVAAYTVWAVGVAGGPAFLLRASVLTLVVLICTRFALSAARSLSGRLLAVGPLLGERLPGLQARTMRYANVLVGTVRGIVIVVAVLVLLQVWGLDAFGWLGTDSGQRVTTAVLAILVTLGIAAIAWEVVSLAIEAYLSRAAVDGTPIERSARMRTLLPLLRKTVATVLAATVALVVLAELGVNIAPLLAGAGIVGIAVGFGAQTLVKDVITGLFILLQDAVAVGDVVTVAGSTGRVEQVSIRSIRLRDLGGTVILIPFSEVTTVKNLTKDFSYAMFEIGVAYREDIDEVIAVIRAIADTMMQEEDFAWRIIDPIEVLGLDKFADSAVIIKARIKTRPVQQWTVMREFNLRMKRRFDELDIEIPFPHQTVYFGIDKKGSAPPARIEAAAPLTIAPVTIEPVTIESGQPDNAQPEAATPRSPHQRTDKVAQPS